MAIITLQSQSCEGQESADKAGSEPWHSCRHAWLNIAGGQNWRHIPLVLINLCVLVFLCTNIYCQNVAFSWQVEVEVSNVILGLNNALQGTWAATTHHFLCVKMQITFLSLRCGQHGPVAFKVTCFLLKRPHSTTTMAMARQHHLKQQSKTGRKTPKNPKQNSNPRNSFMKNSIF